MVGSRIRFLFTRELLQANSFACNNSLVNKNRTRSPICITRNLEKMFDYVYIDKNTESITQK